MRSSTTGEMMNLHWDGFNTAVAASYQRLRDKPDFSDVTLACEDGVTIKAHRVILSGGSSLFEKLLQDHSGQSNPFVYLRGIEYGDLQAVLDYIYHGEVSLDSHNLDGFLAVAEDLKVIGLETTPLLKQEEGFHPSYMEYTYTDHEFLPPQMQKEPDTSASVEVSDVEEKLHDSPKKGNMIQTMSLQVENQMSNALMDQYSDTSYVGDEENAEEKEGVLNPDNSDNMYESLEAETIDISDEGGNEVMVEEGKVTSREENDDFQTERNSAKIVQFRPKRKIATELTKFPGMNQSLKSNKGVTLCMVCWKTFTSSNSAREHYKIQHLEGQKEKCKICNKEMKNAYQLKHHLAHHKSNHKLSDRRKQDAKVKWFQCTLCDYRSSWRGDLHKHIKKLHKLVDPSQAMSQMPKTT